MPVRPEIHITSDDVSEWASEAATLIAGLQRRAVTERGRFFIALSGGRTPEPVYRRWAELSSDAENYWSHTDCFFSDERCVPPRHPDSNFHLVDEALFRPLGIPDNRIHRMKGEHSDPEAAAREYELLLREVTQTAPSAWPRLDLVLLGVGNDGHTASLFPGTDAVQDSRRCVAVGQAPSLPRTRLTLTLAVINQATVVLFLASGQGKADIVKALLEPRVDADRTLPAALVRPEQGRLIWLLDRPAAAKLTGQDIEHASAT